MAKKLVKCLRVNNGICAEDGSNPPGWIGFEVVDGNPILGPDMLPALWYWDADPVAKSPEILPPAPKDMTNEQIAADPMFQLIKRAEKALRTTGPASKRPTTLTAEDKGFRYWNTERKAPEYWNGPKWFDAMGTALT
jgi:hypothetical protein